MSQQSVLAAKARSTVGCMRREALPSGGGRWSFPSTLHCWNTCWVQFWALQQERDMYILEQVSEGLVKSWRVWSRRRLGPLELLPTFGTVTLCWGGINLFGHNTGNAPTLMVFPAPLLSFFLILLIFLQLRSYWLKLQKLMEKSILTGMLHVLSWVLHLKNRRSLIQFSGIRSCLLLARKSFFHREYNIHCVSALKNS